MRKFMALNSALVAGAILALTSGCSAGPAGGFVKPEGESNLSCGGLVYAAVRLIDDNNASDPDGKIKANMMAAVTYYGTAHYKDKYPDAKGAGDGVDAFNLVKLEGMRMTGDLPSGSSVSPKRVIERARK